MRTTLSVITVLAALAVCLWVSELAARERLAQDAELAASVRAAMLRYCR